MDPLRCTVVVDAPPAEVAARIRRLGAWDAGIVAELRSLRHSVTFVPTPAGTLVLDEFGWAAPRGPAGRLIDELVLRRRVLRAVQLRNDALARLPGEPVVVAAAILDGRGRLLAAQRSAPPEVAGRWEFPGGKRETGEDDVTALVRECREELGVGVVPWRYLGELPLPGVGVLRAWAMWLVDGTPLPLEHRELRWVGAQDVDQLDWLDVDRPLLSVLRPLLAASAIDPIGALTGREL